ncbi:MAG TPA: aldo/keto reductase, partial [Kofleriaceae bacterium]|nr:aldo/keto reductase [Kofleriaceae bacterium]
MAIGLGCMRLSTDAARDPARGRAVIAAAIEAGIALLDTADAYALDAGDAGHNERLIAEAVAALPAPRRIEIVTKGGLIRPGGAWLPDGRARHLAAAARASRDRLGVPAIDLYLLHAVDPRTPLATSVRALVRLRDDGVVRRIGLSNVGLTQLEAALALAPGAVSGAVSSAAPGAVSSAAPGAAPGAASTAASNEPFISAVEVELSPWKLDAIRGGLVAACAARGIRVLAHRPLGGPAGVKRAAAVPVLGAVAARLGATPAEVVLAWLASLSPVIVPLPGATQVATAHSAARAGSLALDDDARAALAARFLAVADPAPAPSVAVAMPGEAPAAAPSVVMIVGMPASGKSTLAETYAAQGYLRLNRDERGGSLIALARSLDRALAGGARRVVLDNTYPTRASRAPVIEVARRHGATVRCVVMATSLEQAQANAVARILARHGRLLMPAA